MKAVLYHEYGPPEVLKAGTLDKPTPRDNEILIKVAASQVNYGDLVARNFRNIPARQFNMPLLFWLPARFSFGFRKPKNPVLGSELSGVVEGVGEKVIRFKPGDQVYAYLGMRMGANAEYVCVSEDKMVAIKPSNKSHEEASTLPYGGIMAKTILAKVPINKGDKVLINGASGGIGSIAVQLLKIAGAEVTGVCGSERVDYVKALGADKVIDYTKEDFTRNGEQYDLIFDILGRSKFSSCKGSLTDNGVYLLASFKTTKLLQMFRTSLFGKKKVICGMASEKPEDLEYITTLSEEGKIKTIIDKTFPLEQAASAHAYIEQGSRKGNVVLTV